MLSIDCTDPGNLAIYSRMIAVRSYGDATAGKCLIL